MRLEPVVCPFMPLVPPATLPLFLPVLPLTTLLQPLCLHLKDALLQSSGADVLVTKFLAGSGSVWGGCTTGSSFLQSSAQKE